MLQAYVIRDNKAGGYMTPFYSLNLQEAIRSFTRAADDSHTNINLFPEDFDLYHLGSFNQDSGEHNLLAKPEFVVTAVKCRRTPMPERHEAGAAIDKIEQQLRGGKNGSQL
jgi:hypothetical protein